ncbi:tryptophan--tRNA ligase [Mycoplasmopsis alligatoris]|uniref:Tryptophan--tRNA ligase n=1 Tax=Mycoplasmopsis alligatoris A21JP2 TaxID=747682 RepID=D4XV92_9BACT|nr:tryptophan--tRNA ligase [Mycoplasmopsis alligatoris]EFF41724.1 tryptophan--tRNA ligase [Mycoplasmopsis alligatoris A21JP2]
MKKRCISGIKPTGQLTLGNYIGGINNFIKLQDDYEAFYFIADLHALTMGDNNAKKLYESRQSVAALYLACGLDTQKSTIFFQSDVIEHAMMQWLLSNETTLGELNRMTQFKDKSLKASKQANGTEKIPTGLLIYPTLMAADILLYNAHVVPVGEDQIQHLELTRNIATRINNKYKHNFIVPEGFSPKVGARIKSLSDPNVKMSKSESSKSTIYLLDDPELAYKKVLKAVTDSENKIYISNDKPGVLNLLNIYAALNNISLEDAEFHFKDANYKEFKEQVALCVKNLLIDIQEKYVYYLKKVDQVCTDGAHVAKKIAKENLSQLMEKMGF